MPDAADGFVKRFDGVNHELGFVECSCTNPPRTIHTGLTNLRLAHRIVRTAPTSKEAKLALRGIRANLIPTRNEAYDSSCVWDGESSHVRCPPHGLLVQLS
jgi:hypothetical protein